LFVGLDEQLFGVRIADLHRGSIRRFGVFGEVLRWQTRAAEPVATGGVSDKDERVARLLRFGGDEALLIRQPDASHVDQRDPLVIGVEIDASGDRRDADTVAVVVDSPSTTPSKRYCEWSSSNSPPKYSESASAIGYAPIEKACPGRYRRRPSPRRRLGPRRRDGCGSRFPS